MKICPNLTKLSKQVCLCNFVILGSILLLFELFSSVFGVRDYIYGVHFVKFKPVCFFFCFPETKKTGCKPVSGMVIIGFVCIFSGKEICVIDYFSYVKWTLLFVDFLGLTFVVIFVNHFCLQNLSAQQCPELSLTAFTTLTLHLKSRKISTKLAQNVGQPLVLWVRKVNKFVRS